MTPSVPIAATHSPTLRIGTNEIPAFRRTVVKPNMTVARMARIKAYPTDRRRPLSPAFHCRSRATIVTPATIRSVPREHDPGRPLRKPHDADGDGNQRGGGNDRSRTRKTHAPEAHVEQRTGQTQGDTRAQEIHDPLKTDELAG